MSVNHIVQAGYGFEITRDEIKAWFKRVKPGNPEWKFSDYGYQEALYLLLEPYPDLTLVSGGGGWSNSEEQYGVVTRSSVMSLEEHDGIVDGGKLVEGDYSRQLIEAWTASETANNQPFTVLIAGGFY